MSELDKDSLEVLRLSREADEPDETDRERIRKRVLAQVAGVAATGVLLSSAGTAKTSIGAGVAATTSGAAAATGATVGSAVATGAAAGGTVVAGASIGVTAKIVGAVILATAALGTGGAVVAKRHAAPSRVVEKVSVPTPLHEAPRVPAPAAPGTPIEERAPATPVQATAEETIEFVTASPQAVPIAKPHATTPLKQETTPVEQGAEKPAPGADEIPAAGLQREVALIRAAHQARTTGDLQAADRYVSTWEREFSRNSSSLAEEALAERIFIRCAKREAARAKNDLAWFSDHYPRSPHLPHLMRACEGLL